MDKTEESFRRAWFTVSGELWNCNSTYCEVPYEDLPDVRKQATDDFAWLHLNPPALSNAFSGYSLESDDNEINNLDAIFEQANDLGISLPQSFVDFLTDASLHAKVPTCTACYLALSEKFISFPAMDGHYFLRFLNDSQCCVLWYLWLRPDGTTGVMASDHFLDRDIFKIMEYEDLKYADALREVFLCAENFTEFIYRFWVENSIWFSTHEKIALSPAQQAYREKITKKL